MRYLGLDDIYVNLMFIDIVACVIVYLALKYSKDNYKTIDLNVEAPTPKDKIDALEWDNIDRFNTVLQL